MRVGKYTEACQTYEQVSSHSATRQRNAIGTFASFAGSICDGDTANHQLRHISLVLRVGFNQP